MSQYIQVITTTKKKTDAGKIAKILIEEHLAACVQIIGPISSTYFWEGVIEKSEEWLCIIKTRENLYKDLESIIRKNHSYEVPEILAIPVIDGNEDYLSWMESTLKNK